MDFELTEDQQTIRNAVLKHFAVTEPNTGLDTTKLKTRAERRDGGYLVTRRNTTSSATCAKC